MPERERGTTPPRNYLHSLAAGCAWWSALALATLALSLAAPRGLLRDPGLRPWDGLLLLCTELAALGLFVGLATAAGLIAHRGLRIVALSASLLAFGASWGCFWFTGHFLDREAFGFMVRDLHAVAGYAADLHGVLFAAIAAATIAGAAAASRFLPLLLAKLPAAALRRFTRATVFVSASCSLAALGGSLLHAGPDEFHARRSYATGPSARLISEILERPDGPRGPAPVAEPRPLVTVDEYLRVIEPERFNVLIVVVDSLRADQLRAFGGEREVMPTVERLAREGTAYTDCLTTATHTDYAMPSILSSQYPLRSRTAHLYPSKPPYPRVFLYDLLHAAGWRTGIFSSQDESWRGMSNYLDTGGLDRYFHAASDPAQPRPEYREGTLDDAETVAAAAAWIDESEGPFFVCLNLQNAHAPYNVPRDFARPFGPATRDFPLSFGWYPKEKTPVVKDLYADSLAYIDSALDRLFRHLEERGRWERTIVVVTADHGEAFYEHGVAAHGGPITPEVGRVPLVVRVPGRAPRLDPRPAQILDVPPTVCRAIGLPSHPSFQGLDLLDSAPPGERSRFTIVQTPFARQYQIDRGGRRALYDAQLQGFTSSDSDLEARLAAWFQSQVDYYESRTRPLREYPPTVK